MTPRPIASVSVQWRQWPRCSLAVGTGWHIVLRDSVGAELVAVPCRSQDEARAVAALSAAAHGARLDEE